MCFQAKLDSLEREKFTLTRKLVKQSYRLPQLPRDLAPVYRLKVEQLEKTLRSTAIKEEATQQLRKLVEQIVVKGSKNNPEYELIGDLVDMIALASNKNATPEGVALQAELKRSARLVAGARFELTTFRL